MVLSVMTCQRSRDCPCPRLIRQLITQQFTWRNKWAQWWAHMQNGMGSRKNWHTRKVQESIKQLKYIKVTNRLRHRYCKFPQKKAKDSRIYFSPLPRYVVTTESWLKSQWHILAAIFWSYALQSCLPGSQFDGAEKSTLVLSLQRSKRSISGVRGPRSEVLHFEVYLQVAAKCLRPRVRGQSSQASQCTFAYFLSTCKANCDIFSDFSQT